MRVWSLISRLLPECRLKERLRFGFYRLMLRRWHVPCRKLEQLSNGDVYCELNNGLKFISKSWFQFDVLREQVAGKQSMSMFTYAGFHDYEKYYKVKEGDIVVNVGANVGVFTIRMARKVGQAGLVVAIEPEKDNLVGLRKNIEVNNFNNVIIVPKGVWSEKGNLQLRVSTALPASDSIVRKIEADKIENIRVDTLDNILHELKVGKFNFIKMDIEGAEIYALRGMERTLKQPNLNLAIEFHPLKGSFADGSDFTDKFVCSFLKERGFDCKKVGRVVYAKN